jgi:thiol-disulfide isomerase/thioredoxin
VLAALGLLVGCIALPTVGADAPEKDAPDAAQSSGAGSEAAAGGTVVPAPAASAAAALQEGAAAPDFPYTAVDGASSTLSAHRGSVVLINLWASWCGPCVAEMPEIDRLKQENPALVVLAVNVSDNPDDARSYIDKAGYGFTWVLDTSGEIGSLYPSSGIPYTVIVDTEGTISSIYMGSPRDPFATYGDAIRKAGI